MLQKPIWSAIETTLFYYSGHSTTCQVCVVAIFIISLTAYQVTMPYNSMQIEMTYKLGNQFVVSLAGIVYENPV